MLSVTTNMLAECPPVGSALLAPRLLWLPTAPPLFFYAKGFERHRRCRTLWHGACFSLRACVHRGSVAPAKPRYARRTRIPHEGKAMRTAV